MADNKINMPSAFGGIVRYSEEYESKFKITPTQVIGFVIAIIAFVLVLKLVLPIA